LPKLWVTHRALALRARQPDWFGPGAGYAPLTVHGIHAGRILAFARQGRVATVVPCRCFPPPGGWQDTTVVLPAGRFLPRLHGGTAVAGAVAVAELFAEFPVALLAAEEA
ncbi:MAG TPA: hypothetical protein PLU22_16095, partial [Polyangiaceae bacterium]|nr:hypothetical protein [Polyangiaceae bacterium]